MKNRKILIIDDEKDNLQALNRLLRTSFEVVTATSPLEGLSHIQKQEFSVIVSDQRMPEMTGVELFEKVKHLCPASVRILLTGYTDIESVIEAINRGHIYRYISKPWDNQEIKSIIEQAQEAYQLRTDLALKSQALVLKNQQLEQALEKLKTLDDAKDQFIALVSHELKTPLTVILSYLEMVKIESQSLSQEALKGLKALEKAVGRLSNIVEEILDFTSLATSRLQHLEMMPMNFLFKSAGFVKVSGNVQLEVDPRLMQQAIAKLAATLSHWLGTLDSVEITLGDSTILIGWSGKPLLPNQFEPFVGSLSIFHHTQELGLNLSFFKKVVELHGLSLEVHDFQLTLARR